MKEKYFPPRVIMLSLILFIFFFLFLFSATSLALIPGDFGSANNGPPDGVVDFEDLMIFALAYGSTSADANWNEVCDIYLDGIIDFEDLMIFALHYGESNVVQTTPTFDPPAGPVAFGTTVTITSAGADAIYYTTNGSDPTTASTNQATTPLVINAAVTVKAIAVKAGSDNSAIASAAYTQAATADLTGLALSGSPDNYTFAASTYTYNGVTVANGITSITVTPTGAGTITVNGTEVTSGGSASDPIALTAGTEKTITVVATETGKTAKTYTIKITRRAAIAVGDIYGGGKVAYILQSGDPGYVANEQHGLIAATSDQGSAFWSYSCTNLGTETGIGTGQSNTTAIVLWLNIHGEKGRAAQLCDHYSITVDDVTYSDWFLPSIDELNKLYINRVAIGGFPGRQYWSSSERGAFYIYAWLWDFDLGVKLYTSKDLVILAVRAVRAF